MPICLVLFLLSLPFPFVHIFIFCLWVLCQDLKLQIRWSRDSLFTVCWPPIYGNLPASASWVLELQTRATVPGLPIPFSEHRLLQLYNKHVCSSSCNLCLLPSSEVPLLSLVSFSFPTSTLQPWHTYLPHYLNGKSARVPYTSAYSSLDLVSLS